MPEPDPTPAPDPTPPTPDPSPTETVDFWKQKAREQEKRAKANADAAKKLEELEAANKTEIEKATEKAAAAERERDAAAADALRWKVAAKHGVTDEDAELFLTGTDEETLTKQAERLSQRSTTQKTNGNVVPREGQTTTRPQADGMRTLVRGLFKPAD